MQVIFILIALIAGLSCGKNLCSQATLNNILNASVLFILLIMGYEFGSEASDLAVESMQLFKMVTIVTMCLFIFNFLSVYIFAKLRLHQVNHSLSCPPQHANFSHYVIVSGKYLGSVILGIALGAKLKLPIAHINIIINIILFMVLFIIGFQLKQQGVSIREVLANKIGLIISLIIVISSLCAGIFSSYLLNVKLNEGLMLSSGFGWYTLSGILAGKLINHQVGAASFFIDFSRELIAVILIPAFGRKNPIPFIAYGGATSLDFTLPVIKLNMGEGVVPIAITSGMILTLIVPILISLMYLI